VRSLHWIFHIHMENVCVFERKRERERERERKMRYAGFNTAKAHYIYVWKGERVRLGALTSHRDILSRQHFLSLSLSHSHTHTHTHTLTHTHSHTFFSHSQTQFNPLPFIFYSRVNPSIVHQKCKLRGIIYKNQI
jgi:hypothetical protein